MPSYRQPSAQDLANSREARIARQNLTKLENYVNLLRQAERLQVDNSQIPSADLEQLIAHGEKKVADLAAKCGGRVVSRKRPKKSPSGEWCQVFVDECGSHSLTAQEPLKVFCLTAAIIRDSRWANVDAQWKGFKAKYLPPDGPDTIVHEPDARQEEGAFREPNRALKLKMMAQTIASLDFTAISIVVHRPDYVHDFGIGPVDSSLPTHIYWMALDFLMERVVMALDGHFNGAFAQVIAESRGPKEDALFQYEFARLHLDGTSYIAPSWFRQSLLPGIKFQGKGVNNTGLQIADLIARPIAVKVSQKRRTPYMWAQVRTKLCPEQETKNSILGLKIMPWRERYKDLQKS
jgi:Protein of unknown function (DUF3800)